MKRIQSLAILFAIAATVPAFAGVVDDAIALANKGISDDVIMAWAEGKGGEPIGVNEILRMKEAKVPDRAVAIMIRGQNRVHASVANVGPAEVNHEEAAPVERDSARYVERSAVNCATPAVYAAPVAYRAPLYYSDYYYSSPYYSYPYYSSYGYPYRGFGLSLSFGGHYRGGSRYYGSYGNHYNGGHYGSHYGSGHYGSNYGSGHYGSGHYGSNYGSGYSGYSGGYSSGYRSSGTSYSSGNRWGSSGNRSSGTSFSSGFRSGGTGYSSHRR